MIMHRASCIWKCKSTTTCRFRPFEVGIVIAAESCISSDVRTVPCPNITANFRFAAACDQPASGAIRDAGADYRAGCARTTGSNPTEKNLNASWASYIYSKSDSVQPSALQTLIIIKAWRAQGCNVDSLYIELSSAALKDTVVARQFSSELASLIDV